MAAKRVSSPLSDADTRAPKLAKTEDGSKPSKSLKRDKKGTKKGVKPTISGSTFTNSALPIHVNLTHTPPTIADPDTEAVSVATADPGFIGNLTLIPSTFSTGSFGWKGNQRITVELQNTKGAEKEKVQVQLTINATVIGSKPAKTGGENEEDEKTESKEAEDE